MTGHAPNAAPAPRRDAVRTARLVAWALLIVAATLLAYRPAWHGGFTWDDDLYVSENPLLTDPDGLRKIWFSGEAPSQYFPLVYTTFRLERGLWGLDPTGYHLVNILLHAANALLVWRVLALLRVPGAAFAAAVFALHPVHVESVAWITERKNVLSVFFTLGAVLAWIRFTADGPVRGRAWSYVAALVSYQLALFSKTTACTLPAALVLVLWWRGSPVDRRRWLQIAPFVVLGLAMGLLTMWWERHKQGTHGELFSIGLIERALIAGRAVWFYLGKLAWPTDLGFSYPRWDVSADDPWDYLGVAALAGAAFAVWRLRGRLGRGPETALVHFVSALLPMLGFVMLYTFRYSFVADHYQYPASIGPIALAAAAWTTAFSAHAWARTARAVVAGAVLLTLGALTWRQSGNYRDNETLWRATLATNPGSWLAHTNLGEDLMRNLGDGPQRTARLARAADHFRASIALEAQNPEAHLNLGGVFFLQNRFDDAAEQFARVIALDPTNPRPHANLGTLLLRRGDATGAFARFQEALRLHPRSAAAAFGAGCALGELGRYAEALAYYEQALVIEPERVDALNNLGFALLKLGRAAEAIPRFEAALRGNPALPEAHFNLGNARFLTGDRASALTCYDETLRLRPDHAEARYNSGATRLLLGDRRGAADRFSELLARHPDYPGAREQLARALAP